jgi:hypothetical protein
MPDDIAIVRMIMAVEVTPPRYLTPVSRLKRWFSGDIRNPRRLKKQ